MSACPRLAPIGFGQSKGVPEVASGTPPNVVVMVTRSASALPFGCGALRSRSRRSPRASSPKSLAREPGAAAEAAAAAVADASLENGAAVGGCTVAGPTLVEEAYNVGALGQTLTELHQVSMSGPAGRHRWCQAAL